jgi:hypothetical protein
VNAIVCDDLVELTAQRLRAAEAMEIEASYDEPANSPDYDRGLTSKQLEVMRCEAKCFAMLWGRRTGKTHVVPRLLLRAAAVRDAWAVYITKTRKNAQMLLWRWLKKAARELGIAFKANETLLLLEVVGGGSILLGGCDDLAAIESYRQFGWALVVVDEMGVHASALLSILITDVIEPATVDNDGTIVYLGTPGYVVSDDSIWYALSGPNSTIPVFRATARDNTAVPGIWDRVLARKLRNRWDDDHPTWVREYEAQWVVDASTLVYPYDPTRNSVSGLPTHTPTGRPLSSSGWRYCLGVDIGFVDATAFTLVAVHEDDPCEYVVSSEQLAELLPDQVAWRISQYLEQRPWTAVVMDAGGMGKIHAAWAAGRDGLPIIAAEKTDKASAIRDARGAMLSGQAKVLSGPQNTAFRTAASKCGWDKTKTKHADGADDHALDAWVYARRHLHHFVKAQPLGPTKPPELIAEERFIAQREAAVMGTSRAWWDQ